jgi:hypothetical protein
VDPSKLVRTALNGFSKPCDRFEQGIVVALHKVLWPESICPIGRGYGMNLYRKSLDLAQDLLVSSMVEMVMRILLFWKRVRRRPRRVPRVGSSNSREEVSRRRTWAKLNALLVRRWGTMLDRVPIARRSGVVQQ